MLGSALLWREFLAALLRNFSPRMITRPELAVIIRKVAAVDIVGYVAHFSDELMESVRVRLVRAPVALERIALDTTALPTTPGS